MNSMHRLVIVAASLSVFGFIHAMAPSLFTPAISAFAEPANNYSIGIIQDASAQETGTKSMSLLSTSSENHTVHIEEANFYYDSPYEELGAGSMFMQVDDESGQTKFIKGAEVATHVDINVTGMIARTKVTQQFSNNSDDYRHGVYSFPLPENAAVDHLLLTVGDRRIEGQIKRKAEAKAVFQAAKKEGKKASLVSQRRPNIFTNEVANIGPGESIEVTIEYQQSLTFKDGKYSLRFPLEIKPRYSPASTSSGISSIATLADSHTMSPIPNSTLTSHNTTLNVSIASGNNIQNIISENHEISTSFSASSQLTVASSDTQQTQYDISLLNDEVLLKDFVLTWEPELGTQPLTSHFTQYVNGEEYGLIMIYPPLPEENLHHDREVTFVLDTSGSMAGDAIKQAKQALAFAVDDLSASDKFNIIQFNSSAEQLWRSAKYADKENKLEAFEFIASLEANGGTEMHSALSIALDTDYQNAQDGFFKQVLFITDGSVSNEHELMQLISAKLGEQRLFTIGIGAAPNSYFMTEAAKMGKGTFTFIADTSQVNTKMRTLLNKIKAPALTDIKLNLKSLGLASQFEMYPNKIGDLYSEEPLVLTYKKSTEVDSERTQTKSSKSPLLLGSYKGNKWEFSPDEHAQNSKPEKKRAAGINVLWAREKIAQLNRDKRTLSISSSKDQNAIDELIEVITSTALHHHIVSDYTSLVAVDLEQTAPATNDTTKQAKQLKGLLPKTATRSELMLLIGFSFLVFSLGMQWRKRRYEG